MFRRKVQQKNRDLVIIFWQGKYGIFSLVQLAGLVGLRVKPPEEGGKRRPGRRLAGGGGAWRVGVGGAGGGSTRG